MKKITLILVVILSTISCTSIIDTPEIESQNSELVPSNFRWETMEYKSIELINDGINIYNGAGAQIASNLSRGTYYFAINRKDTLIAITDTKINLTSSPSLAAATPYGTLSFPSKNNMATFLADASFPEAGNGCYNDIVIGYNFQWTINNSNGSISKMTITLEGETFPSGAAIALKFKDRTLKIKSVSESSLSDNGLLSDLNSNGTEKGQGSCVIVPLADHIEKGEIVRVEIEFEEGYEPYYETLLPYINSSFKSGGISLFVVLNERGHEIFTKGNTPTDKFDYSLFKTAGNKDFSSSINQIWALSLEEKVAASKSSETMQECYPMMEEWIQTSGAENNDWFKKPNSSLSF